MNRYKSMCQMMNAQFLSIRMAIIMVFALYFGTVIGVISPSSLHAQNTRKQQQSQEEQDPIQKTVNLIARFNYTEATDTINQYLKDNPESGEAWFLLGICRNRLGLFMAAHEVLVQARSLGVQTKALNRELGMAHQGRKKWAVARHYLRKADQDNARTWLARAQVAVQLGNHEEAIEAADKAMEMDPELSHRARFVRAYAFSKSADTRSAEQELERAMQEAEDSDLVNEYQTVKSLLRVFNKEILSFYRSIFYRKRVDEEKGVIRRIRIEDQLKENVKKSVIAFREETGDQEIDSDEFRSFVTENPEHKDTLELLEDIQELYRKVENLEQMAEKEQKKLREIIISNITPEEISQEVLVDLIRLD